MRLLRRYILFSTTAVLLTAGSAAADSIQVTSGSLTWQGTSAVPITLSGDGFSFSGTGSLLGGVFGPWVQCSVPECVAGTIVNLGAQWSGGDLPGTATYEGTTFTQVGSASSTSSLLAQWTGELALPDDFAGGTLTAPVQFTGFFTYAPTGSLPAPPLHLFGTGTAALTFAPWAASTGFPDAFALQSATYTFESGAATPEPASLLLLGSGAALLAARRRRRRPAGSDPRGSEYGV